jgi:hypothetical protein
VVVFGGSFLGGCVVGGGCWFCFEVVVALDVVGLCEVEDGGGGLGVLCGGGLWPTGPPTSREPQLSQAYRETQQLLAVGVITVPQEPQLR